MVLWKARHANIRIGNSITVVATNTLYDQLSGTQYESKAKNVKIKIPEGGSEGIPLLGEDADGYQNEEIDRKRRGKAEATFDLLEGNLDVDQWAVTSTATSGSGSAFTLYNYGDDSPATAPALCLRMNDGTDTSDFLLNNAEMVSAGETGVDGEGHSVRTGIKFECLARDFFVAHDIGN